MSRTKIDPSLLSQPTKIIQIVSATTSTQFSTTSSSFSSTALAASITPSSTSNKVKVTIFAPIRNGSDNCNFTIDRSGTNLGDSSNGFGRITLTNSTFVTVVFVDSPATTSSRTYTFQIKSSGGTTSTFLVDTGTIGQIVLEEIVP